MRPTPTKHCIGLCGDAHIDEFCTNNWNAWQLYLSRTVGLGFGIMAPPTYCGSFTLPDTDVYTETDGNKMFTQPTEICLSLGLGPL